MEKTKPTLSKYLLPVFILLLFGCGDEKQQPKLILDIPVIPVLQKDVPILNDFVGQTFGYFDIAIRARVEGFLVGLHFQEGSFVKKGQLLYAIDPEPFRAKVAESEGFVAESRTRLALAKSDLDRVRPLVEINAMAKSDLDAAEAKYKAAQARLEADLAALRFAKIELGYCSVRSPIDGLIGKTEAKVGDFVGREPNPVVLNAVSRIDTIQVRFSISETKYLQLARLVTETDGEEGKDARDTENTNEQSQLELILADGSTYDYKGKFDFSDRQVDPTTGTLLVQVSFPNPKNILLPGQFARVRATIGNVKGGLVIPQRCIRELQGQFQTFTVNKENIVEIKTIEVANRMDSMWVVTSGLNADDMVVYGAIQKVSPGMEINPVTVGKNTQE